MDLKTKHAAEIIKMIEYINIASITPEGLPWNTPVFSAYDKKMNFYWFSWGKNQHSINIKNNPNTFITIYDSNATPATNDACGIYLSGKAYEITNVKDITVGLSLVYMRLKQKMRAAREFLTHFPRRVYRFTPKKAWINGDTDINGNYIDIREELSLDDIKKVINARFAR